MFTMRKNRVSVPKVPSGVRTAQFEIHPPTLYLLWLHWLTSLKHMA